MAKAIEMAVEEVNRIGPPMGRPLKLYVEDDQTDPQAAVTGANKLINVNKVSAIVGMWASGSTLAVAPNAIQAGVLVMNVSGAEDISYLKDNDLVWRFQPTSRHLGLGVSKAALEKGWKKVGVAIRNDPAALTSSKAFTAAYNAAGGEVTGTFTFQPNATDFNAELQRMLATKPDAIIAFSYAPELAVLLTQFGQTGSRIPWMTYNGGLNASLLKGAGPLANGLRSVTGAPNVDSATYKSVVKGLQDKYSLVVPISEGEVFMSYDMVVTLSLAMEACKCTEGKEVAKRIRDVSGPEGSKVYNYADALKAVKAGQKVHYVGASGELSFDQYGDASPTLGLYEVVNGQVTLVKAFVN